MFFKRLGRTFSLAIFMALAITMVVQASAGGLDCSFGNYGRVTAKPDGVSLSGRALAVYAGGTQADKLVMAGTWGNYGADMENSILARFNADGTLDTTFHSDGFSEVLDSGANDYINAIAPQNDGRVLVVGRYKASGESFNKILLARFTTDGSLDTTFSSDGWLTESVGEGDSFWYDLITDASGNIYVAGTTIVSAVSWATILVYDSSGARQKTWTYNLDGAKGEFQKIIPDGSGGFYAAGNTNALAAIVRINSDGSFNTAFDSDGKKVFSISIGEQEQITGFRMQSDGKLVFAGIPPAAAPLPGLCMLPVSTVMAASTRLFQMMAKTSSQLVALMTKSMICKYKVTARS